MRNNEIDKPTGRRTGGKNLMRSPEEKEALIKEWEASGLGTRPFLESKGIPRTPFMRWLRSYEKDGLDGLKKKVLERTARVTVSRPCIPRSTLRKCKG